jgi:DNA replication and repair protein RecF
LRLTQITPQNFRNLFPEPVSLGSGTTVVAGENAQGKSNLLEAVALLCGQRSFRGAVPAEISSVGEHFAIDGEARRGFETERFHLTWRKGEGRAFFRAGKAITYREASASLPAVFLAPEHRQIFDGGPAARRRFLDRLVLGARPAAGADLARFERALSERNALLARCRDGRDGRRPAAGELEAWSDELAAAGSAVRRHRVAVLEQWRPLFQELCEDAGPEYAGIEVRYEAGDEGEADLRAALGRLLAIERRRGHTLAGPHRDELLFQREGRALSSCASTGELHRTLSLLRLSEWHAVERATGEAPLFGADDFDAGLSPAWVESLLASLPKGAPVLLTTATEASRWRRRADNVLEMRAGRAHELPRAVTEGIASSR